MNKLTTEIQRLKNKIEDTVKYPFLDRHIVKQEINDDKLAFVTAIITKGTFNCNEKQEAQIVTIMLVQIALDIHELVPDHNSDVKTKKDQIQKELHVLAGDYYSGLYYFLLSQINDFTFIQVLASAIKEINEYKMVLNDRNDDTFEDYLNLKIKIESLLINYVSDYMDFQILKPVIHEWITLDLLHNDNDNRFQIDTERQKNVEQLRNQLINKYLTTFEIELNKLPDSLKNIQTYFTEKLNHLLYFQTKVAEEG